MGVPGPVLVKSSFSSFVIIFYRLLRITSSGRHLAASFIIELAFLFVTLSVAQPQ